jgi:hypothetical protein
VKLKLTKKQRLNLLRLSQGKHISVCTQVGRSCGKVLFENGEEATSYLAAINTFYRCSKISLSNAGGLRIKMDALTEH